MAVYYRFTTEACRNRESVIDTKVPPRTNPARAEPCFEASGQGVFNEA